MDIGRKLSVVLQYLMMGGEVEMKGRTYVWLNNEVVKETKDNLYVIDGLAIKGRMYNGSEDEVGEVTYMGQKDIPLHAFIQLVSSIEEKTIEEILINTTLTEYNRSKVR